MRNKTAAAAKTQAGVPPRARKPASAKPQPKKINGGSEKPNGNPFERFLRRVPDENAQEAKAQEVQRQGLPSILSISKVGMRVM